MKLAIIGGRNFNNYEHFLDGLAASYSIEEIDAVVSGTSKIFESGDRPDSTDEMAKYWAEENGIEYIGHHPDWKQYGRAAGPIRNTEIVNSADAVLAYWNGKSRGTADTIKKAKLAGIPIKIVHINV